ncbi:Pycsar system effector family protein [Methylomicrobium sp. RS1]|uniref:Pycsar system effector family protein n=1 Tax=Candidatus Methylomicrobium oryzae TaxID=2802053 RepID=UPI001921F702|nr:Pycsar system effector family protein [Methylomicrobium sp. RS1]MBL1262080.1 hypothetical protein [Methylomicrobium sp. RS1]
MTDLSTNVKPIDDASKPNVSKDFISNQHGYIREMIGLADRKASFFLASSALEIGYLSNQHAFDVFQIHICQLSMGQAFCELAILFLGLTILSSMWCVWPKYGKGHNGNVVSWVDIADGHSNKTDFVNKIISMNEDEIRSQIVAHSYDLSKIVKQKFIALRYSAFFISAGTILSLASLIAGIKIIT